jgi:hypothetical protein
MILSGALRGRIGREAAAFAAAFAAVYVASATVVFHRAPRLFAQLDQAFDADLGFSTIDLARAQGPHLRSHVHPLLVLLLNPVGSSLKAVLQRAGIEFAARLAACVLCALAGAATVGAFRVLLSRLGVADSRARLWTLVFGLSATQVVFSSLPESYAFSALGLTLVFVVAAAPRSARWAAIAAGVFAFGITVTNLVAVALAPATAPGRRLGDRLRASAATTALVVLVAIPLSLVQRALFTTTHPFFVPERLPAAYVASLRLPPDAGAALERLAAVVSHLGFAGLAAPRLAVDRQTAERTVVDFASIALLTPTPAGALHWLLWAWLLARSGRGLLVRARGPSPASGVLRALLLWLGFCGGLHFFFGTSLFLYSGHWVFALVAVTAAGTESRLPAGRLPLRAVLVALAALELVTSGQLLVQVLRAFA